ncbi:hypothetical protein Tco_0572965 [Tanacetum coccineum]
MSDLFSRKNTHNIPTSSKTDNAGTIHEASSSETLPDTDMNMTRVVLPMNWKVIEEISKAINAKKGVALNKLSAARMIQETKVLENQTSGDNTQDARNNKGKGNNKAKKSKKNKGTKVSCLIYDVSSKPYCELNWKFELVILA